MSYFTRVAKTEKKVVTVRKGMYEVGRLANLIQELAYLQSSCEYECKREGDDSSQATQLLSAIGSLSKILKDMVEEETDELLETAVVEGAYVSTAAMDPYPRY